MNNIIIAYKIRDNNTGLFSEGGINPKFSKNGKTWSTEGHCKAHLTLLKERNVKIPNNWEIVILTYDNTDDCVLSTAHELAERKAKK